MKIKLNQNLNNVTLLRRSLTILEGLYRFEIDHNQLLPITEFKVVTDYLTKYLETRGSRELLRLSKASRTRILRYLGGQNNDFNDEIGMRRDRNGLPSGLGKFKDPKVLEDPKLARFTMTIIYLTRGLQFPGEPDFKSITETQEVITPPEFEEWLRSDSNPLSFLAGCFKFSPIEYYPTVKAGPNGPALMGSFNDLISLPDDYRSNLISFAEKIDPSSEVLQALNLDLSDIEAMGLEKGRFRKIEVINDKEGKKRVVAIPDYWLQTIMKSLHESLNRILEKIPEDCTFNQENFKSLVRFFGEDTFHSIDLKAATELMPSNGQASVLGGLVDNEEFGSEGKGLMCNYEWDYHGTPIQYRRGQPMGVYSSGPMMALTHHLMVHWAASRKGISLKRYALLGDDLLIVGDELYNAYKEVVDSAEMILNESKTFQSPVLFEFAKRFYFKASEISPFPIGAVLAANGNLPQIAVAIDNAFAKSGLTAFVRKEEARRGLLKSFLKAQIYNKSSMRNIIELERMVGITALFRGTVSEGVIQAPETGGLVSTFPCGRSIEATRHHCREVLSFLLLNEANKRSFEYLQASSSVQMHLMMSPLATLPDLMMSHPAMKLCELFQVSFSNLQNDVLEAIRNGEGGASGLQRLLIFNVNPVPSLTAMYRQEKRSVRKVETLGKIANNFKIILDLSHEQIRLDMISPEGVNLF